MTQTDPRQKTRGLPSLKAALAAWRRDADRPGPPFSGRAGDVPNGVAVLEAAASIAGSRALRTLPKGLARDFLETTSRPRFLSALGRGQAERWAEIAFRFIRASDYSLKAMFDARVEEIPHRVLFQDMGRAIPAQWTYEEVGRHVREIAAALYLLARRSNEKPRVAIFSENHIECTSVDLACLFYDILVTPLNPHFSPDDLTWIFDRLGINIAVTDTEERASALQALRARTKRAFLIVAVTPAARPEGSDVLFLGEFLKRLAIRDITAVLNRRKRFRLSEVSTVMFTSGSTGAPKGVSFSTYQLVAKRFARAAALPEVGEDEVFLSFLPLYHTFGRYLELLGSIFWRGTYVFAGNPSVDTLLTLFPKVNPTGFISVPVRWAQLYERCLEKTETVPPGGDTVRALRSVVGSRLRWGLSAAGYLDARVFRYFERAGIFLSSGFGMTEGTGGLTMTVPGRYEDDTHGLPLPGLRARLGEGGELQASGHYVARYLEDKGPGDTIPYPRNPKTDYWLATGDVFRVLPSGYYQIVDRIKDIYKNNRGQTIAPRKVESRFAGVPGIKSVFLVGDGRPHNVLFIVPDRGDEVLKAALDSESERAYYRRIISAANLDVAPYERVVNFAVLDRDFDPGLGELTPKGSFNRKAIETSFRDLIDGLYRTSFVELQGDGFQVRIPLWFYRDLGILEDEIALEPDGLRDLNRGFFLPLKVDRETGDWLVGDLEYPLRAPLLDLGLFARQPYLWGGNPALVRFSPCKEGWDVPIDSGLDRASLPWTRLNVYSRPDVPKPGRLSDPRLAHVHGLLSLVLFGRAADAGSALAEVETLLGESEDLKASTLIRRRLEALARHPDETVRCRAYRLLLLDEPNPGYGESLPTFVQSGLPFLNEESIEHIVSSRLGQGRFDSLRQRMCAYREKLDWPAAPSIRPQFERIFRLLVDFARVHPQYYASVRAELAAWVLHRCDSDLAASAQGYLAELGKDYEAGLSAEAPVLSDEEWARRIVFEDGLDPSEATAVRAVLTHPLFLRESVLLAYDRPRFNPAEIVDQGIWVSRISSSPGGDHYRISVNTRSRGHYDLRLVHGEQWRSPRGVETALWLLALANYPYGQRILPQLGAWRPDLGALSWRYSSDLTVWEKIREFAGRREAESATPSPQTWRKLFIDSFAAFFRATDYGGFRVVPGLVSPSNVIVPEVDFREEAVIASLEGWTSYAGPRDLVRPMLDAFYRRTAAGYPWAVKFLDVTWIFDACYEALGHEKAGAFLDALLEAIKREPLKGPDAMDLAPVLEAYLDYFRKNYMIPIPALNAINKYKDWELSHTLESEEARDGKIEELSEKYGLGRFPEIVRYYVYRHTYFAGLGGRVCAAFDRLLDRMGEDAGKPAVQLLELSDLQAALKGEEDRRIFSKMVFPRLADVRGLDILKLGAEGTKHVVVHSRLKDDRGREFTFSETQDPAGIGQLYRLFFKENYPKVISERDLYFVVKDGQERVVGGLCYHVMYKNVMFIDAVVVSGPLKNAGLGRAMLADFSARMAGQDVQIVLTHFFLPAFFLRCGFKADKRWGALVKYL